MTPEQLRTSITQELGRIDAQSPDADVVSHITTVHRMVTDSLEDRDVDRGQVGQVLDEWRAALRAALPERDLVSFSIQTSGGVTAERTSG
jgi:hypothetical protein